MPLYVSTHTHTCQYTNTGYLRVGSLPVYALVYQILPFCVYASMCVCNYVCAHVYALIYVFCEYVCVYVCMQLCMCVCMQLCMCVCMQLCTCVCFQARTWKCAGIYCHSHNNWRPLSWFQRFSSSKLVLKPLKADNGRQLFWIGSTHLFLKWNMIMLVWASWKAHICEITVPTKENKISNVQASTHTHKHTKRQWRSCMQPSCACVYEN